MIASLRMGGAERQLAGLAVLLKQAGHDVDVLTYRDGDFYAGELADAGVSRAQIPQKGGDLSLIRATAYHLRAKHTELLISFLAGTNVKACLVKRQYPELQLIVSERNCNTSFLPHDRLRFFLYKLYAQKVVSNSYAQTEFIRAHAPALQGRLYTIPNFADLERFSPGPSREAQSDGLFRIACTARLAPRKNALGLIKAAALCPGIRIDWYGAAAKDAYFTRCTKAILTLGLERRFFIHEGSSAPESVYREADAFCLPSFYEGTSNSLAEALASGLPAACRKVSDNPRYVQEGRNGYLFNPSDVNSIAFALRRLASMKPEALLKAGQASRAIALSSFSQENFLSRYEELICGPAEGKKGNS